MKENIIEYDISINIYYYVCLLIIDVNFSVKRIYDYNKKVRSGEIIPKKIDRVRYIKSAVTIQRAWRRYAARKAMKKRIARLEEALDMMISSWRCNKTIAKDDDNFQRRRALMPVFDARTKKAISDERIKVIFQTEFLIYIPLL